MPFLTAASPFSEAELSMPATYLEGKLRVESGWLIADPEEFTLEWNLILRVIREFGGSLLFQTINHQP